MTLTETLDIIGTILWTITAINLTVIAIIVVRDRREERLAREQRTRMWAKMENWNALEDTDDKDHVVDESETSKDWSYHSDNEDQLDDNDVVDSK